MSSLKYDYKDGRLKIVMPDSATSSDYTEVNDLVAKCDGLTQLALDMQSVMHIHSKVLSELINIKKISNAKKFRVVLLNVTESAMQVLEFSNIDSLFVFKDDYSSYMVDDLIAKFADDLVASEVSNHLGRNYTDEVRNKLLTVIKGSDTLLAEYAILTMGKAQDYDSVDIYRTQLKSKYHNIARAAILVLGWVGDDVSKNQLYDFLSNENSDLAEAAAASIALLSDKKDSERLKKYINHEDTHVRKIAVQALSLINDDLSYDLINERMAVEKEESVRVTIAKRLSFYKRDGVISKLIGLLDDKSINIREAAASGIVRIGPKNYIDAILAKVCDEDSWVGFFATKSLIGVEDPKIAKKLIECYYKVDENVKLAIIEVLGKVAAVTDERFLADRLTDSNEDIRKEALNSLSNINSPFAVQYALEMHNADPSWLVRYKAVDIIIHKKPLGYDKILKEASVKDDNRYIKEKLRSFFGESEA